MKNLAISVLILQFSIAIPLFSATSTTAGPAFPAFLKDVRYQSYVKKKPMVRAKVLMGKYGTLPNLVADTALNNAGYRTWADDQLKRGGFPTRNMALLGPSCNAIANVADEMQVIEKRKKRVTGPGSVSRIYHMQLKRDQESALSLVQKAPALAEAWESEPDAIESGVVVTVATSNPVVVSSPVPAKAKAKSASFDIALLDTTKPTIGVPEIGGKSVWSGDFLSTTPLIQVRITDESISSWNMQLLNSANTVIKFNSATGLNGTTATGSLQVLTNAALGSETYRLVINAQDSAGNTQTSEITGLVVKTGLSIGSPLLGPNPYNPNKGPGSIEYQLTEGASVHVVILSANGSTVWDTQISQDSLGGQAGFNRVLWDGKDRFGNIVANGPYVVYLVAKNSEKSVAKIKVLVLK